jgi:hypothetical protein
MTYSTSYSHLTNFGSLECNVMYVCIENDGIDTQLMFELFHS